MDNNKLNNLINTLTKELKEDIKSRVTNLEKKYAADTNQIVGAIDEIIFQMQDWKDSVEAVSEDTDPTMFPIAKIQWEAKLEIINHMDSVLERELGRFGYTSVFEDGQES